MKLLIFILFVYFSFLSPTADASALLDIYEEYASADDEECRTYPMTLSAQKNSAVVSEFSFSGEGVITVEITKQPLHGTLTVDGKKMQFTYTPDKDFSGSDHFHFRVSNGRFSSNISKCKISVGAKQNASAGDFRYADLRSAETEYAAKRLVELDILKGERIGKDYYFYPNMQVSRATAKSCIEQAMQSATSDRAEAVFSADEYFGTDYSKINSEGITRADFLYMTDRAMSAKTDTSRELLFADAALIPDYAVTSVKNLASRNIISNKAGELLRPNDLLTKEEMAKILCAAIDYTEAAAIKTMAQEIKEHIYFDKIM